jgi:hypothetical protein
VVISELRVGDLVYSVDGAALAVVPVARINRVPVSNHVMVHAVLTTGEHVDMSPRHPTVEGRPFSSLAIGDRLGDATIERLDVVPYSHPFTYDILPSSASGAYFANGVVVGSTLVGR